MTDPVFHLEGVLHSQGELEDFEGPLVLILQLLSKNRIEIRDISISLILDQYLDYLREMEEMDLEVASEFVAMASHLAYIKSRMLLAGDNEEITELEQLMEGLERLQRRDDYAKVRGVTESLKEMYTHGAGYLVKPQEPLQEKKEYPYQHSAGELLLAISSLMDREEIKNKLNAVSTIQYPQKVTYPVSEKAEEIAGQLRSYGTISLAGLFYACRSRSEMVAVFVSVLEMCKSGAVILSGEGENTMLNATGTDSMPDFDQYEGGAENGDS